MPPSHLDALLAYTRAWSEPNMEVVKNLLAICWSEESEIIGPGYYFKGTAAVLSEIERYHKEQPDQKVILTSGFDSHGSWSRFAIAVIKPDGSTRHEGWDIVEHGSGGKIRRVVSFWGQLPTAIE